MFCSDTKSRIHKETKFERLDTKEQWTVEACSNRYTEEYANEVVDGNNNSEWIYQQAQQEGFYLIVDFGKEQNFEGVCVDFGETTDYARGFQLYTSADKKQWEVFGGVQIVDGTARNEVNHVISTIMENERTARFLKMELTESVLDHWLRVNEISLFTSEKSVLWYNS